MVCSYTVHRNSTMIMEYIAPVFITVNILLLGSGYGQSPVCRPISSRGKVFMFGVMGSYDVHIRMHDILINVVSNQTGIIGLLAPHFNMSTWHNIDVGVTPIRLSKDIICYSGIEDKGILLAAEFEVSIYVVTDGENSVQRGFLLLPMDNTKTGDEYFVSSYTPAYPYPSTYLIVAVNDYTVVSIKNKTSLIKTFKLESFNTYQFKLTNFDPSGLSITVNDSVAVFSGSECSSILDSTTCHSLAQQLMPIATWGTSFIVPPLVRKPHNLVRIYSGTNQVTLLLQNHTSHDEFELAAYEFKEIMFETDTLFINCSSPVQVVQYSTGYLDGNIGDAFMAVVQPIYTWMSEYTYEPLQIDDNYTHYLAVSAHVDDTGGILLNGETIGPGVLSKYVDSVIGTFVVSTFILSEGKTYTIKHRDPSKTFGVLAYGYAINVAYGFTLGLHTSGFVCDEGHVANKTSPNKRLTCLSCIGVTRAEECEEPVTCQLHQSCYVKRYRHVTNGAVLHESGCISAPCTSPNKRFLTEGHITECEFCCATDRCNTYCNGTGNFLQNTIGNIY